MFFPVRFAIGIVCIAVGVVSALAGEQNFQRIGAERGLEASEITALLQDRTDFLWVGTREGLFLYEGYGVTRFEHDVEDPASLADNQVRALFEDREGRLWVGTNGGGLDRVDRATWRFIHHQRDSSDPVSILDNAVFALTQDRSGVIWVGTQTGLCSFDPSTGRFGRQAVSGWVVDLLEDQAGRLWVVTFGNGTFCRPAGDTEFRAIQVQGAPAPFHPERARCVEQDAFGTIWIGVAGGLLRFDGSAGVLRAVEIPIGPDAPSGVPMASDLAAGSDGTLWVATPGGGLVAMDPRTLAGTRYTHRFGVDNSLSSDDIERLHLGRDGTLWIGTEDGTLNQLRRNADLFTAIPPPEPDSGVAFGGAVIEDVAGRLWQGSFGDGVAIVDPANGSVARLGPAPSSDTGERAVTALFPAGRGGAWVGTTIGLARYSAEGRPLRWWRHHPDDPVSLGRGYVEAIHEASDGTVWVGTAGSGLYRMREDGSGFDAFRHSPREADSLGDEYILTLAEDRQGTLWIGTRSSGVNLLARGASRPRRFVSRPGDLAVLAGQTVSAIVEDRAGRIWIGTLGSGLYRVELGGVEIRVTAFHEQDGLPDENVTGVLEDDDASIWVSTRRGLARLDPERRRFATWGSDDGLRSPRFVPGSAWRGRAALFFGSLKGVVSVRRGSPFPRLAPSPTALTSLRTLEGRIRATQPISEIDRIAIKRGDVLFVDYAVLDYRQPNRHRFAYRLGGPDSPWIDVGNRRGLTFTDLDPGKHVLSIRGRNANGVWNETAHPLTVEVVPPFWMTSWFRLAGLLGVVALALGWHRARTVRLERRNIELLRLTNEREKAYERLRALTRRLEDAKEDERRNIARELHDELGQALSAIKINLGSLARLPDGVARDERLVDALTLVDDMIGHVRELSLDLRPPLLDELGLVAALRGYAEGQSQRSGVVIEVAANAEGRDLHPVTAIAVFRIVQEAIHNVLRHAGARRVAVSVRVDPDRLALSVRDDGRGFDVEGALARAASGGHLGLLGMRERVEALGGRVEIDSEPGRGTEVRAAVPLAPDGAMP